MSFLEDGFCEVGPVYKPGDCSYLMAKVRERRKFDNLFLSEAEYRADPQHKGVNPRPGRNLLADLSRESLFIFDNHAFRHTMSMVLGHDYHLLDYKFVMGVPHSWMPDWLIAETKGLAVANLGAYVRPEYRDITYFHGIDFHQDIIDWKDRPADFITAYVYLEDTDEDSSPLYVVPGSHKFGATVFPHKITDTPNDKLRYEADDGRYDFFDKLMLTGVQGTLYFWHALTLHGTRPHQNETPRISVRLLVEKNSELDRINRAIEGPLSLAATRRDLSASGEAVVRFNVINEVV